MKYFIQKVLLNYEYKLVALLTSGSRSQKDRKIRMQKKKEKKKEKKERKMKRKNMRYFTSPSCLKLIPITLSVSKQLRFK